MFPVAYLPQGPAQAKSKAATLAGSLLFLLQQALASGIIRYNLLLGPTGLMLITDTIY